MQKGIIRLFLLCFLLLMTAETGQAQNLKKDFPGVIDSLCLRLKERTTVSTDLTLESVIKRGSKLDFRFSQELSDFNWNERDLEWFRQEIDSLIPEKYKGQSVGDIFAKNVNIKTLVNPELHNAGEPADYRYRTADPRRRTSPLVARIGAEKYYKGLSGRYIALWQSHGRYYEESTDRWEWQRAPLHRTVEDVYTQSYVLPFLIPMLENAGAYVLTPRERDIQSNEVIIDNDPSFDGHREYPLRRAGLYSERGRWSDGGIGFADAKKYYTLNDNPFRMGTVRKTEAVTEEKGHKSEAIWSFEVPESGDYAVYISYKSLENSCESVHYSVTHSNGKSEYLVNQKLGGGTWIYLGTHHFDRDSKGSVRLDNIAPENQIGSVIIADGVKIGGGMGKIARGPKDADPLTYRTSGLPCYLEGALYWEQFAGVDSTVTRNWEGDYTQDYASRGAWVSQLTGGSAVNPNYEGEGKRIPVDLSLGFHSDAGITPNDSIVGTLSIYTLMADGKDKLPNGRSRQLGRHLAGVVQDQIVADLREDFDPQWSRRFLWNRNYSESRTTSVPGMLLELLSHQNFADQKYGLDPAFRFVACRAVYKGILKFLSDEYGQAYAVQPLPVNSLSALLGDSGDVKISWKETKDNKEPTAAPKRFYLQTRVGDGEFSEGKLVDFRKDGDLYYTTVGIDEDELYSFRIVAENDGGLSFPSEVVCAGRLRNSKAKVLVVNNFDRVSAPAWIDSPDYAGFDASTDAGVPYIRDFNFIGDNYEFRRSKEYVDDDESGFGASYTDAAGSIIPGNTFDFISIHADALMKSGYSICSASRDAYISGGDMDCKAIDLICGKQVTTKIGAGNVPARYEVFPKELQQAIRTSTASGKGLLISGEYIATDVWDQIYPMVKDSLKMEEDMSFVKEVLGYEWVTNRGSRKGSCIGLANGRIDLSGLGELDFNTGSDAGIYRVETPDGIKQSDSTGISILRYGREGISAAIACDKGTYNTVCFGFPLETLTDRKKLEAVISQSMNFLIPE